MRKALSVLLAVGLTSDVTQLEQCISLSEKRCLPITQVAEVSVLNLSEKDIKRLLGNLYLVFRN